MLRAEVDQALCCARKRLAWLVMRSVAIPSVAVIMNVDAPGAIVSFSMMLPRGRHSHDPMMYPSSVATRVSIAIMSRRVLFRIETIITIVMVSIVSIISSW